MVHTLRLDNYSPTPRKLVLGTNSSYGTDSIKIERGAGWDGLNLTATGAQPMPALAGANTVLTDADSATVTGRADPIKRITDLEDAVASQT